MFWAIVTACCLLHGCWDCGGMCYHGWPCCGYGYYGCYGGCYPCFFGAFPDCYGGYDCYGGGDYGYGWDGTQAPAESAAPAQARVVVALPADASFFIDDKPWTLDPTSHSFLTPALEPGYKYTYILKAEVKRGGKTLTETRRATVLPGGEVKVEFTDLLSPQK
jgi:uncharacterized protein (TIGR03000 family)